MAALKQKVKVIHSNSQLGNGDNFLWKQAPRSKFDAGADRFLKNGAQNSIT